MATKTDAGPRSFWPSLIPLVIALVIGGFLFVGLGLSPKEIPSVLIGKNAPQFDLPALPERQKGLKTTDLKGQVSLVNVFASWCVSCQAEHPLFMKLYREGVVPVHGLNYKDGGDAAVAWLRRHGDPYDRVGADRVCGAAISVENIRFRTAKYMSTLSFRLGGNRVAIRFGGCRATHDINAGDQKAPLQNPGEERSSPGVQQDLSRQPGGCRILPRNHAPPEFRRTREPGAGTARPPSRSPGR